MSFKRILTNFGCSSVNRLHRQWVEIAFTFCKYDGIAAGVGTILRDRAIQTKDKKGKTE